MCSPHGSHYQEVGFGHLADLSPQELARRIEDAGLFCESAHFQANQVLENDPARVAEYANGLGLTDVVMSGSGLSEDASVDEIMRWGERCNEAGEILADAGLRLGYHNHRIGPVVDGKPQYVHILNAVDPELVTMQCQFQAIRYGYDIAYYLKEYAGRFSLLHMADYDPSANFGESSRLGRIVPVGEGMIDWSIVMEAALMSDIADHGFVVEMESEQPWDDLETSLQNLRSMKI
jgi:sugar phosphate isomerase/epimerase